MSLFGSSILPILARRVDPTLPKQFDSAIASSLENYVEFSRWPPEKKVREASVIVLTKSSSEGGRIKSVISEILKQAPVTTFNYQVGDEYALLIGETKEGVQYGDGFVAFFTGSPARLRYSTTYYDGRLPGLGDMTLEQLRALVPKQR